MLCLPCYISAHTCQHDRHSAGCGMKWERRRWTRVSEADGHHLHLPILPQSHRFALVTCCQTARLLQDSLTMLNNIIMYSSPFFVVLHECCWKIWKRSQMRMWMRLQVLGFQWTFLLLDYGRSKKNAGEQGMDIIYLHLLSSRSLCRVCSHTNMASLFWPQSTISQLSCCLFKLTVVKL